MSSELKTHLISNEEFYRSADAIIVSPRVTKTLTESYSLFPNSANRDFTLSSFQNVKTVHILLGSDVLWVRNIEKELEIQIPFWRDLDILEKHLFPFNTLYLVITSQDLVKPFSCDFSYTPVTVLTDCYYIWPKLKYCTPLICGRFLVTQGGCSFVRHHDMRKEEHIIYSTRNHTIHSGKYSYTISTNEPLQKDLAIAELGRISGVPPYFFIEIEEDKKKEFERYVAQRYPELTFSPKQLGAVDNIKSQSLREEEINSLGKCWQKILDSEGKRPKEVVAEEQNIPIHLSSEEWQRYKTSKDLEEYLNLVRSPRMDIYAHIKY